MGHTHTPPYTVSYSLHTKCDDGVKWCILEVKVIVNTSKEDACMCEEKEQIPVTNIPDEEVKRVAVELMEEFDESFKELAK